jgi:outer membrane protein OmpA-like peptidoglycan-associated protein
MVSAHGNPLADLLAGALGGDLGAKSEQPGRLKRLEPHAVAIPVLLNERVVALPAIHARGVFGGDASDWYILDDPENPLVLRAAGRNIARVVRIAFPSASEPPLEERLKTDVRVELHGIYFDVGKATLRPESEPVLRDIAAALVKHRDWKIGIEGHTDNVGGDADNLNLSRRRADAVKQALIERYHIAAASLATSGYGASRPKAANTSLAGRAQNRRVELVRQ